MKSQAQTVAAQLAQIVGAEHFLPNDSDTAAYGVDGVRPGAVVRPGSVEEVCEIVKVAGTEGLAVVACGGRTKLGVGMPPSRYDVAMDMTRMNRVLAYDPGDLTLGVEPGMRICRLQAELEAQGQFLPLLVPFFEDATVGGIVASQSVSPWRNAFGTARDFVLGIEFVTGEGKAAKSGGRVVKNVTGFDLHKLLIGSVGTLAVITRVNFRTFPAPRNATVFVSSFAKMEEALRMARAVRESALKPLLMEILSPQTARILAPQRRRLRSEEWSVVTAAAGNERLVDRYAADLSRMGEAAHSTTFLALADEERDELLASVRESLRLILEHTPGATIVKVNALPTEFGAIVERAERIARANDLALATVIRASGTVYAAFVPPRNDEETRGRLAKAWGELERAVREVGATAMIEFCPAELKQLVNVWGAPRADWELMRRVKGVFDPKGIFSPGRFARGW